MNYKKNRSELINEQIESQGRNFCSYCGTFNAFKFHCHHLCFKSHCSRPEVNKKENLIILCDKCHTLFHNNKSINDKYIKERGLEYLLKPTKI